jgi:hypothetical protein
MGAQLAPVDSGEALPDEMTFQGDLSWKAIGKEAKTALVLHFTINGEVRPDASCRLCVVM